MTKEDDVLVLTRKLLEGVTIAFDEAALRALLQRVGPKRPIVIHLETLEVRSGQAKLGITADPEVQVHRDEIWQRIVEEQGLDPVQPRQKTAT